MPSDPRWPTGVSLLRPTATTGMRNVGLLGIPTFATSITPRSVLSAPSAIRAVFECYSTWSFSEQLDLADTMTLVDYGDVVDPDANDGAPVALALEAIHDELELLILLGGDNAATWHAMHSLAGGELSNYGLVTLDAHLDMREGVSNGSPVRQLLEAGLDGRHVVQVGLADFSNSAHCARQSIAAGITLITRDELRSASIEATVARAMAIAGKNGQPVYVDIDMDVGDRSVVPGCPAAAPGGLSADEMRRFVRAVTRDVRVRAIDITEIDVDRDSADQRTVRLAALLILEALAGVQGRHP